MRKLSAGLLTLFLVAQASAAQFQSDVIALDLRQDQNVDISSVPADVLAMLLNKGSWGDEPCVLRFFSYGPRGDMRIAWSAAIFNTQPPAGWTVYSALTASKQQLKIACNVNVKKLESDSLVGLDMVCWK